MNIKEPIEAFNINVHMFTVDGAKRMDDMLNEDASFEHNSIYVGGRTEQMVTIHNECSDTEDITVCYEDIVEAIKKTGLEYRYISVDIALMR